jgi:protein-disulfide isomerase
LKKSLAFALVSALVFVMGCAPSASQLKKVMEEHPDILYGAIEKDPKGFLEVVNKAARNAQMQAQEDEAKEEASRMEEEFKNPKEAKVSDDSVIFGDKSAPVTIVEYSDFECPYCARGFQTVKEVRKSYGDKVRIVYKNFPLEFHPMAMPAARYFTAIAMQGASKAEKFHDILFGNQGEMKEKKEAFLDSAAKKAGADMARLKKDLSSEAVTSRINADMEEAKSFGFSGTPGFLINGVSLRGAYPFPEFKKIIDRHLSEKK